MSFSRPVLIHAEDSRLEYEDISDVEREDAGSRTRTPSPDTRRATHDGLQKPTEPAVPPRFGAGFWDKDPSTTRARNTYFKVVFGGCVLTVLAIFSVLIPIVLVVRLTLTNTTKLYDETWTLLFLGPLYNHYRHGSQLFACLLFATNLAFGITIGCGQKSGTAQAIVILVVEVMSALGTSVWLPWGQGASMGLISFLFCVARIVIAVLLVILTPIVS